MIVSAVLLLATPLRTSATTTPLGDEYPNVKVENGNFVIYFSNSKIESEIGPSPLFRVVYSPTGELLAPRHQRPDLPKEKYDYDSDIKHKVHLPNETLDFWALLRDQPLASYVVEKSGKTERHRLPWPERSQFQFEAASADSNSICIMTWSGKTLNLNRFHRNRFEFPEAVVIGDPVSRPSILGMREPMVSNMVQIRDRYCFGWIRFNKDKDKYETIISSWKPGETKTSDIVLDEISDWNSYLSLAAIGDRVCLAYHCSVDGEYPGFGKIIVAFRKIESH